MELTKIFEKVRAYAYSEKLPYEFDFQAESLCFRIDYWKRADGKFESFLKGLGFKLEVLEDEDCGNLYSYKYSEKPKWFSALADNKRVEVTLHSIPELDEQYGDDILYTDVKGNIFQGKNLIILN